MTELVLILGINLAGLLFAIVVARWTTAREHSTVEVRRLGSAVERASRSFLAGCFRQVALAAALGAALLGALYLYVSGNNGWSREVGSVAWSLLGLVVGASLTCVVAHFAALRSHRASLNLTTAMRISTDRTLAMAMRTGGSIGLLSDCISVLGVCSLLILLQALSGESQSIALENGTAHLLGGYAIGTALAALLIQRGGAVYDTASGVGAELGGELDARLGRSDPRNPAAVANLVGDHVGKVAARTVDLFVCASVAYTAVMLVGLRAFDKEVAAGSLSLLLLPMVVKSMGVIASAFGVMVVRTEESQNPAQGVWRGHVTTLVICLGALLGSSLWLVDQPMWPPFFVAGSLGLLVAAGSAHAGTKRVERRLAPRRSLAEALKVGDSALLAEAWATGFGAALLPSLGATAALVASWHLGQASGQHDGGVLAVSLALMTMLAAGPFMLAANLLGPITSSARGIARIATVPEVDEELARRTQRLGDTGSASDAFAQSFWILVGGVAALFAASSLLLSAPPGPAHAAVSLDLAHPAVAYSGLLGAVLVLVYMGGVLGSASRSMRGVVNEVERQLRGFPKERGKFQVPADYIPSYRACIEIVARSALGTPLLPVLAAVMLPVALGPLLSSASPPMTARAALASFVLTGAVTGLTLAFAADALKSCLGSVREQARSKPGGAEAGLQAGAFAELFGAAAGPAAQLALKAVALGSLAIAPFLT